MFRVFAIICIMEATGPGVIQEKCQTFYETGGETYETNNLCLQQAEFKAIQMTTGFDKMNLPYESMQFGCEKVIQN